MTVISVFWTFSRRSLLLPMVTLSVMIFAVLGCNQSEEDPSTELAIHPAMPRAILLVTIDTLRADHVGCYGYARPTTPRLDALAAQGVQFMRAFSPMPTTDPSHVSMLTGLHPRQTGVVENGLAVVNGETTLNLASWLHDRGFQTAAITSRSHLDPQALQLKGFDESFVPSGSTGSTNAENTLERALSWIEKRGDERFFLWVHFWDPHMPYNPPREPERSMFVESYSGHAKKHAPSGPDGEVQRFSEAEIQYSTGLYDGEIRYADDHVGQLIDTVRQKVASQDLLIVITSDHGETLGEWDEEHQYALNHGEMLSFHELHVPLVFSWPGRIAGGSQVAMPVSVASIAPTLADLLDGEQIGDFPSVANLLVEPLLGEDESGISSRPLFCERRFFSNPRRACASVPEAGIIVGDFLYVENTIRGDFLHRFGTVPAIQNLAAGLPEVVEKLATELHELDRRIPKQLVDLASMSKEKEDALRALGYVK